MYQVRNTIKNVNVNFPLDRNVTRLKMHKKKQLFGSKSLWKSNSLIKLIKIDLTALMSSSLGYPCASTTNFDIVIKSINTNISYRWPTLNKMIFTPDIVYASLPPPIIRIVPEILSNPFSLVNFD